MYSQVSSQLRTDGRLTAGGDGAERADVQPGAVHKQDERNSTVGTLAANLGERGRENAEETDREMGELWDYE